MDAGERVHIIGQPVLACEPKEESKHIRWIRRSDARDVFGVGKDILDQWVIDEKVEAHKLYPGKNGTVVFSADDISRAIQSAPRFIPTKKVC